MRHEIKDDRLKVYGKKRVKNVLKTPNIQDLCAGVFQPANCILEHIKGWQAYNCLRQGIPLDYAHCPAEKRNIYRNFWKPGPNRKSLSGNNEKNEGWAGYNLAWGLPQVHNTVL